MFVPFVSVRPGPGGGRGKNERVSERNMFIVNGAVNAGTRECTENNNE